MPILNIEVVGNLNESIRKGLAGRLADAVGNILASRPQGTWVKLFFLTDEHYSENQCASPPQPVFVSLIQADVPKGEDLEKQIRQLTEGIAAALERPKENVHIIVEPSARGRIAFGGNPIP